ncbi:NnrS family protein [Pseudidiomarina taiwanensis]|uniref:NnrS family protein n=1 Tax=Pseudidiomarina taiwanensis TaxID=337250 RepID=A0A432ZGM3_9GAMM|nr:NnrS family protein [Pseudidiomarina taiwanensis]RUO76462.1 NnrS family protein [Pseudidiomarina taiwanensis]
MLNIVDNQQEQKIAPLLRLGFRPFFLFGSLFATLSMALWLLTLKGVVSIEPLNGMLWWHSHEMLFGFTAAIIAGFLLTAVQTWTNIPSIKGGQLLLLVCLWFLARLLILSGSTSALPLAMIADLMFLPLTAFFVGQRVVKIRQYRNLIFIPVLVLMSVMNLFTYLPSLGFDAAWQSRGMQGMTLLVTFLVAFLGGRVIPMFTANGTKTTKVLPIKWLEMSALASLVFVLVLLLLKDVADITMLTAIVCLTAAVLHTIRQWRWRIWVTLNVPLVWSLHFTMLFIPIGLGLLSLHFFGASITLSTAIHSLTVGVIGGMILAMMSRVSLGHTGRMLHVGKLMSFAFFAVVISAIVRSIAVAIWPQWSIQFWVFAGCLWCVAFGLFFFKYLPVLSAPRVDGRPG